MYVVTPFWVRPGSQVPYPGLRQTADTCVHLSIASAINWLANGDLSEAKMIEWVRAAGYDAVDFRKVLNVVLPKFSSIDAIEYHDHGTKLGDPDALLDRVRSRGVLVLSLEVAMPTGASTHRLRSWHMLSVFNSGGPDAQVWDTNGYAGFLTWSEVREVLTGDALALPRPPVGFLVPHAQHHCLFLDLR